MARLKIDPRVYEAVTLLPTTGEVPYDQWKDDLVKAGKYGLIPMTRAAKVAGLVQFRNEVSVDGSLTLMVSRASAGGGA